MLRSESLNNIGLVITKTEHNRSNHRFLLRPDLYADQ